MKRYSVRPCDEDDNGVRRRVWDIVDNQRREHGEPVSIESWIKTRAEARQRAARMNAAAEGSATDA